MKKIVSILLLAALVLGMTACSCNDEPPYVEPFGIVNYTKAIEYIDEASFSNLQSYGNLPLTSSYTVDKNIEVSRPVFITTPGVYKISGNTTRASICVSLNEDEEAVLILDNINIDFSNIEGSCNAPIYSEGGNVTLVLPKDSVNNITDSSGNTANGAINIRKGNLRIEGEGTLNVNAESSKNGIHCGKSILISGGNINVKAANHGIYGKEGLNITGGIFNITANRFGLKSGDSPSELNPTNTVGDMLLTGCRVEISSLDNGIDVNGILEAYDCGIKISSGQNGVKANDNAVFGMGGKKTLLIVDSGTDGLDSDMNIELRGESNVKISSRGDGIVGKNVDLRSSGEILIETKGEFLKSQIGNYILRDGKYVKINPIDYPGEELYGVLISCKGVKATDRITLSSGNIAVSSTEDGIHSTDFEMFGGKLNIVTEEDGVHTLGETEIRDGELGIHKSYKGFKATSVHIEGGMIQAASFSDGIDSPAVTVDGGEVYLFDKVDVGTNGSFKVNGGTVLIVASSSTPSLPTETSLNSVKCTVEKPQYAMHTSFVNVYGGGVFVSARLPKGYTQKISVSLISDKLTSGEYTLKLGKADVNIKGIVSFKSIDIYDAYVQKLHK